MKPGLSTGQVLVSDSLDSHADHRFRLSQEGTPDHRVEFNSMAGVRELGTQLMEQLAADGDETARDELIVMLRTGSGGVDKNLDAAKTWLLKAAEAGDPGAMERLTLWDSPLVFLLFALRITIEWIFRKIFRML